MKKIAVVLGWISALSSCSYLKSESVEQQEFVNPIFNKPLLAYSRTSWNTMLMPNSVSESPDDFSFPEAYIEKHNCKLLENEFDHIKYSCTICHQYLLELGLETKEDNCYHNIIIYQITDDGLIRKTSFDPKRPDFQSIENLKVLP